MTPEGKTKSVSLRRFDGLPVVTLGACDSGAALAGPGAEHALEIEAILAVPLLTNFSTEVGTDFVSMPLPFSAIFLETSSPARICSVKSFGCKGCRVYGTVAPARLNFFYWHRWRCRLRVRSNGFGRRGAVDRFWHHQPLGTLLQGASLWSAPRQCSARTCLDSPRTHHAILDTRPSDSSTGRVSSMSR